MREQVAEVGCEHGLQGTPGHGLCDPGGVSERVCRQMATLGSTGLQVLPKSVPAPTLQRQPLLVFSFFSAGRGCCTLALVWVRGLLSSFVAVVSLVAEPGLQARELSTCGERAQYLW